MQITNGVVEYSRTVRPADFESKVARVSLTFAVDETEANPDQVVAKVFDMAMGEVHRRLGMNVPAYAQRVAETPTGQVAEKPAAQVVTLSAAEVGGLSAKGAAAAPQPDPSLTAMAAAPQPDATVAPPKTAPNGATATAPAANPLSIVPPVTAPADSKPITITDNDLHAAVHQAVERKVLPAQVRELTAEFTGVVGRSMTTIPQDKRAAFLAKVKELRP